PPAAAPPPRVPEPPSLDKAVQTIYRQAGRIAKARISVLIRGESGTGKEVLARFLHAAADRPGAPFVALNCAALPRDLLEVELFGIEERVATGVDARAGKFEQADGGTLFLDEIGDMPLETQAKILRVLQEQEIYRVGGDRPRATDAQVLAATNRDLDAMVRDGAFRSDLYHRLAGWVVRLPPLRERRADIPQLAAHFLAQQAGRLERAVSGLSRSAVDALTAYRWPGNIRELSSEMHRALLFLDDGELVESAHLRPEIAGLAADPASGTLRAVLERTERAEIELALATAPSATAAAEKLGIGRSTLYRRMAALGVGDPADPPDGER
ncbi:MAG: sigma-54 dependent transcriptional regulator, partial [Acidobacteriota bacterium]